jgi:hypothetical protein
MRTTINCWDPSLRSVENHPLPVIPAKAGIQLLLD